ncbi:MAG: hypothetical protein JNK40_07595 [Chromatiales bacterium]|nr:hypothetical protein [Chromatiales bacterium]
MRQFIGLAAATLVLLAGCAADVLDKSADFDRHRNSRIVQPFDKPDTIYFDVRFGPDFPEGDPAAEEARMTWLQAWLEQRRLCTSGHEVAARRPFDYLEDNPAGYQQRWEIRCVVPAAR